MSSVGCLMPFKQPCSYSPGWIAGAEMMNPKADLQSPPPTKTDNSVGVGGGVVVVEGEGEERTWIEHSETPGIITR